MGMEAAFEKSRWLAGSAIGRGTRIPDLPKLLAIHAVRQAAGRTVRLMRESDLTFVPGDEPDRLTLIFAVSGANPVTLKKAGGSFNTRVAACMAMGGEGETEIYSGS